MVLRIASAYHTRPSRPTVPVCGCGMPISVNFSVAMSKRPTLFSPQLAPVGSGLSGWKRSHFAQSMPRLPTLLYHAMPRLESTSMLCGKPSTPVGVVHSMIVDFSTGSATSACCTWACVGSSAFEPK